MLDFLNTFYNSQLQITGAVISHIASNDVSIQIIAPFLLAVFTVLSWYLRPADRKIVSVN